MREGTPIHFPASNHPAALPPAYLSHFSDDHIDLRLICRASYHLAVLLPASLRPDMFKLSGKHFALPLAVIVSLIMW